ncbi:MAG: class I SAM-dependent methyltransferase [Rubricella sp.]
MTNQLFWDRAAPRYARKPIADPDAYRRKLALVSSLLAPTDRVLEVGCGTGSTALRLAPEVAHYTATDASGVMIEIAKDKLGRGSPGNLVFHRADADARVTPGPFDAICGFSLLHLVPDVAGVLAALHAQLKPGGLLLTKTVCVRDAALPIRLLIPLLHAVGIAPRVTALSLADLHREMAASGFVVERTVHFGSRRMSPFIVARKPA